MFEYTVEMIHRVPKNDVQSWHKVVEYQINW